MVKAEAEGTARERRTGREFLRDSRSEEEGTIEAMAAASPRKPGRTVRVHG